MDRSPATAAASIERRGCSITNAGGAPNRRRLCSDRGCVGHEKHDNGYCSALIVELSRAWELSVQKWDSRNARSSRNALPRWLTAAFLSPASASVHPYGG